MKYLILLVVLMLSSKIFGEDIILDVVDNVPSGTYNARVLTKDETGKTVSQIYGKLTKVTVPKGSEYAANEINEMCSKYVYYGRVDRKLNEGNPVSVVFNFDNGYAGNGIIYGYFIKIDGYYFIKQ